MTNLYFDCTAGIAGDMTVAALVDLGVPFPVLQERLALLPLPPSSYRLRVETVERHHIRGTRFVVEADDHHSHRHYSHIRTMIDESALPPGAREQAQKIFLRLAEAEAKVHGVPVDKVHFHEVGAIDSIVDIVGTAVCLDYLGVESIYTSPLPYGSGFVESAHGRLPVPAPATAELLRGLPVHFDIGPGERVTPTGAAIIAALASPGVTPSMRVTATGCGAGTKDFPDVANILRATMGEAVGGAREGVRVIETHLDDMNPELLGYLMDHLLSCGALDVAYSPLQMKKNRPGTRVTVICSETDCSRLSRELLHQSTAIGVRSYPVERLTLDRRFEHRETSLGAVRVKVLSEGGQVVRVAPEYEECRRIARETGRSLLEVYRIVEGEVCR